MITAYEARELVEEKNKKAYAELIEQIRAAATVGKSSTMCDKWLTDEQKEELRANGFILGLQNNYITYISW